MHGLIKMSYTNLLSHHIASHIFKIKFITGICCLLIISSIQIDIAKYVYINKICHIWFVWFSYFKVWYYLYISIGTWILWNMYVRESNRVFKIWVHSFYVKQGIKCFILILLHKHMKFDAMLKLKYKYFI